jgi:hypothetical protein
MCGRRLKMHAWRRSGRNLEIWISGYKMNNKLLKRIFPVWKRPKKAYKIYGLTQKHSIKMREKNKLRRVKRK